MAIWHLRKEWDANLPVKKKLRLLAFSVASLPQPEAVESGVSIEEYPGMRLAVNEVSIVYRSEPEECCF
jgi:hypothetical protein